MIKKALAIKGHYSYVGNLFLILFLVFLLLPERAEGVCNLIGSLTKPVVCPRPGVHSFGPLLQFLDETGTLCSETGAGRS